jgi:aspartate carbamoyltransferase catalytic subunit
VRHLLGIDGLTRGDAELILQTAAGFVEINERAKKKVPVLQGRTVALMFFEDSTRTRLSFDLAAKRLSADVLAFSASGSSVQKGETLLDTIKNLEAMKPDLVVVRHQASGAPWLVARGTRAAIVNAGDGQHEHPTQALLDAFTLLQRFERTPQQGLDGLTIAIVGDIARSRVARSNLLLLPLLGARVRVCGPRTMLPLGLETSGVEVHTDVESSLDGVDAVMTLRIQKERAAGAVMASDRDYALRFGLTRERFARLPKHAVVMHPGPINRGVEIDHDVADDPRAVILRQAENGVVVRMAVLYLLATTAEAA